MDSSHPRFACDAMLRGLARWIRAWGYDATWTYGIDDVELLSQAVDEGRIVLTADSGILARRCVRLGRPRAESISRQRPPLEQLVEIATRLKLARLPMRCLACGGRLIEVDKDSVAGEIPPRTYRWLDRYQRCTRCRQLFWPGTHHQSIQNRLDGLIG